MKIALVQMCSTLDFKKNIDKIRSLLDSVKSEDFDAIFLPECFYSLSDGKQRTPHLVGWNNEHFENIRSLAIDYNAYLIGGSVSFNEDGDIMNRALNFDPTGKLVNFYDKINLFACDINKDGVIKKVDEADIFTPGSTPAILDVLGFKIGIGICFDLRFPDLLLNYYKENCDIITFASAFTVPTGKAHWEILLRARAIEGQCYVVASGQVGQNHENVQTYGHSMVVDPWGEVLSNLGNDEGVAIVELKKSEVLETRQRVLRKFK